MPSTGAIVLVGPMGVGKTTIGKKLAKKLGMPFVDTDQLVTRTHGPISEIFLQQGESAFRRLEEAAVLEAIATPSIVATGGGAVLSEHTRAALTQAKVVYLSTDGRHIANRLVGGNRPLLKDGISDWRRIYESRKDLYEQVADFTVDTSKMALKSVVDYIIEGLGLVNEHE